MSQLRLTLHACLTLQRMVTFLALIAEQVLNQATSRGLDSALHALMSLTS
jgi:hypothetical protein